MRGKRVSNRRPTDPGPFQPYEEGYECLMGKPKNCRCHLCVRVDRMEAKPTPKQSQPLNYETNFQLSVRNPYSFVLMHLCNEDTKNPLNIPIPEVCVFVDGAPYNLYYPAEGHIRGYRSQQHKVRRVDIPRLFRQLSSNRLANSKECHIVRFISMLVVNTDNEYMMLSDTDLQQLCHKSRADSIWQRVEYIYNKVPVESHQPVVRTYNSQMSYPDQVMKLATESLVGYTHDADIRQLLADEDSYLDYLNIKIVNLLNYQHNIRVARADFSYLRSTSGGYYLINVQNMEHSNWTQALRNRQQRLERQLEARNNRIILTPRRQQKIKHMESRPMVGQMEAVMNDQFERSLQQFNIHSVQFSQNQQAKNEQAFKKLHPLVTVEYKEILQQPNFQQVADRILGNSQRRSLVPISKNSCYNFYSPKVSNMRYPFYMRQSSRLRTQEQKPQVKSIQRYRRLLTNTTNISSISKSRYQSMRTEQTLNGFF